MGIRKQINDLFRWSPENPPKKFGSSYFFPIFTNSSTYNGIDPLKAFMEVPEVSAVINAKARMFSRMILRQVSKATGEDVQNREQVVKIIRNPNWFQSQREFLRQTKLFRDIYGREYLYLDKPYGVATQPRNMYTLPPGNTSAHTVDKVPFYLVKEPRIEYVFQWGREKYPIDQDFIVHLNDNRVQMTPDNWVDGASMLESLAIPINNIRAAYEARNVLIENRGALGILSNAQRDGIGASLPLDEKEKDALQDKLKAYGLSKNKAQWIITNLALTWQSISIDDPTKLGLMPEVEADFQKICDSYGVDRQMFATVSGTTFENQKWGERRTYENTVIPEAQEWIDAFNSYFDTASKSWTLVGSFEHIAVLQENMKERGQALTLITGALSKAFTDGAITLEEYQAELAKYGIKTFAR